MDMRHLAVPALACALIGCSRPKPAPVRLTEPTMSASSPLLEGAPAASASSPLPESDVDIPTVAVPPLDTRAKDALAAFVTAQRLLASERYAGDSVEITPLARDTLPVLKRTSLEATRHVIRAAPAGGTRSGKVLSMQVLEALRNAGAVVNVRGSSTSKQEVGAIKKIEIKRPTGHPTKLGVVIELSLPCDEDSSLYVLEEQPDGAPTVLLVDEANGYTDISSGHIALAYRLSVPDDHGGWFAVISTAAPWCSSAWRGIRTRVLEPGSSAEAPRSVWSEHSSAFLEHDEVAAITAGRDDFEVRYVDHAPPFSEGDMRDHVHHYVRRTTGFERVQPIVAKPIDLPGEWIAMPWAEARRFVPGGAAETLRSWHQQLERASKTCSGRIAVKREDEALGRTRLSLTSEGCKALPPRLVLDVEKDGDGWVMAAIAKAQ
jgi:hypothetical protein